MKLLIALLLVAAAALGQMAAPAPPAHDLAWKRDQALQLMNKAQPLAALPLVEDLVAANPNDGAVQGWLAYCLFAKSRNDATADEVPALRKRARDAALRAKQLGSTWAMLDALVTALDAPPAAPQPFSSNPDANAKMKEGEQAFGKGDNQGALSAYSAALKLDPKLYHAALFAGDVCFRAKDIAGASEWFGRAVAIDPVRETAYRYWGDALMAAGKMMEAREKFIEAVIAEPAQLSWGGLANWAKRNNCTLSAPKIDRPNLDGDPQKLVVNPQDLDDQAGTGRSAWIAYSLSRAAWRQALFVKNYPKETQYRHSLAEETAALEAAAGAIDLQKSTHLDPQLANLLSLKRDGMLEAWILLSSGTDAGIAQDYASYRAAHHVELRAYFDKYIIHSNPNN